MAPWAGCVGLIEPKPLGMECDAHTTEVMDVEPSDMERLVHTLLIHEAVTYVGILAPEPEEAAVDMISKLEGSRIRGDGHQGVH